MRILVVNCGSSSLKAAVVEPESGKTIANATVERVGDTDAVLRWGDAVETFDAPDHGAALGPVLERLRAAVGPIDGVGHRVVHGGERFDAPTRITDEVEATIEALVPLAPLHNPANLAGIRAARALLPDIPHVAIFDTAFHATLPRRAKSYAIPQEVAEKHGVRRFGFHGTSHSFVARRAAEHLGLDVRDLRLITCHLGNGCSMAAVEFGRSVETSMGMTPLEGLVMGSRSGDLDVGAVLALLRTGEYDVDALDRLLNYESGLTGLSGIGNDVRDIEARAATGDARCQLALHVFSHRVRKYIGAYAAVMGGVDAIVFTAGIGENSVRVRHTVSQRLEFLGAVLDEDANREVALTVEAPVANFAAPNSRVALLAVQTDEQWEIARQTAELVSERDKVDVQAGIPVAVSARHVHLDAATFAKLFGEDASLTEYRPLSQPGQFAAEERVNLIGPKRTIEHVRILGPFRKETQVEVSTTDEFHLGVDAPVRASGHIENTPGITLEGPKGRVTIDRGVICALRHIHMHPDDAIRFGVNDKDIVDVAISSDGRDLIFGDVLVRVSPSYRLEMHIDTDEANAAGIARGMEAALVPTERLAWLRRRK
jgi:acetate kinase